MPKVLGRVTSIAINPHKVSFLFSPEGSKPSIRFVLFDEAPNTHTVPQVQLATQSWMLALLQTSLTNNKLMLVTHDEANRATQVELVSSLDLDFDFGPKDPKEAAIKGPLPKTPTR